MKDSLLLCLMKQASVLPPSSSCFSIRRVGFREREWTVLCVSKSVPIQTQIIPRENVYLCHHVQNSNSCCSSSCHQWSGRLGEGAGGLVSDFNVSIILAKDGRLLGSLKKVTYQKIYIYIIIHLHLKEKLLISNDKG